MDGNGDTEAENVIRLPRDWVGPPEELVPIGSRARPREGRADDRPADDEAGHDGILDAGDFWGESAASVHHVMQAPTPTPTAEFRPLRRRRRPRRPRAGALPHVDVASWVRALPRVRAATRLRPFPRVRPRPRIRRRTAAIATVLGAVVAIAVIGVSEGPGVRPAVSAAAAARVREPAVTSQAATNRRHHPGSVRATRVRRRVVPRRAFSERRSVRLTSIQRHRLRRGAPRTRHPTSRLRFVSRHAATPSAPAPVAVTTTVAATTTTTPTPTAPTVTQPSATQAGQATATSTTSTAPARSSGPLGPGAATGCDPKCS